VDEQTYMIISFEQLEVYLLILARIGGIFIQAPVLSIRTIPGWVKTAICIWVAAVLWFIVPIPHALPPNNLILIMALINEVLIGYLIGFVCSLIFEAIRAAGDIMDLQMGLSIATIVSPVTGGIVSVVGQLAFLIALIIFFVVDGHHMILSAFHQSFRMLPLAAPINIFSDKLALQLIDLGGALWSTALQMAIPVILIIFLSDFTFGIVSRVAPQVNVFMLGFQVKPSLGFIGILFILPLFIRQIIHLFGKMGEEVLKLFLSLK